MMSYMKQKLEQATKSAFVMYLVKIWSEFEDDLKSEKWIDKKTINIKDLKVYN